MEFRNVKLVVDANTELEDLDRARSLLNKLPLIVISHERSRNAAGFAFMKLGINHHLVENGRHLAVLSPCSDYSVEYEGFNHLSPEDYKINFSICGGGHGPKSENLRVDSLRVIPRDNSEMVLDLAYRRS